MSKKTPRPPRIATLQRIVAEPITDPAEQAAVDKLRKRQKRATTNRNDAKAASGTRKGKRQ